MAAVTSHCGVMLLVLTAVLCYNNVVGFLCGNPLHGTPQQASKNLVAPLWRLSFLPLRQKEHFKRQAAWSSTTGDNGSEPNECGFLESRREWLQSFVLSSSVTGAALWLPALAHARADTDDDDEANFVPMYNADGSLIDPRQVQEAQQRVIQVLFPPPVEEDAASCLYSQDGSSLKRGNSESFADTANSDGSVVAQYEIPVKWKNEGDNKLYTDATAGLNAKVCERITAYRCTSTQDFNKILTKASQQGVASSLRMNFLRSSSASNYFPMGSLSQADVLSGRKVTRPFRNSDDEALTFYEFDLAVAPPKCVGQDEQTSMGLGFCAYSSLTLLSAVALSTKETSVNSLYVLAVECTADEWRDASAELKRVRSSFQLLV